MRRLRERNAALSVVVMTAWGSVPSAVEAMRLGARDYVEKPWNNERLLTTLRTHAALTRAQRRDAHDEGAGERGLTAPPPLIAESAGMQAVRDLLERIANSDASVLRVLETGELQRVGSSRSIRVDIRVLAATNADLDQAVAHGRFRPDL